MSNKQDISYTLIYAVRKGRLSKVKELISSYELSYSEAWSEGYVLLRYATEYKHHDIAKLLLTYGSKVNSKKKKRLSKTPLHYAVENGDIELVKMLLDRGAVINARDRSNIIPLHCAVVNDKIEIVELLLNHGANVNATCPIVFDTSINPEEQHRATSLHIAVERECLQIVGHLLKHGACVNSAYPSTSREGYTPLHIATTKGSEEIVKLLLISGASTDAKGKDSTSPIYHAVEKGYEKVVELLLEAGANVNTQDRFGNTILRITVQRGYSKIVETILKYCPDVNNEGNRDSLVSAIIGSGKGYCKIVKNLLQYGFTVNSEYINNCQLLHAAIEKGYLEIVEQFIKRGINVNMIYNTFLITGCRLLHVAVKNRQEDIVKLLVSCGANINAKDKAENRPIFYAVQNNDIKITKWLLDNGTNLKGLSSHLHTAVLMEYREIIEVLLPLVDINTCDYYGRTALHFSSLQRNSLYYQYILDKRDPEIVKLLLNKGANVNAKAIDGTTTLHLATHGGFIDNVKVLLKYGAEVDSKNYNGVTSLLIAAEHLYPRIVPILLEFGANIDSTDEWGRTALHIASKNGHGPHVEALLDYGSDINSVCQSNYTALDYALGATVIYIKSYENILYDLYHQTESCSDYNSNFIVVTEILKQHITKMKVANRYLNKKNLLAVSKDYKISYLQECEEEITRMKSEKIYNSGISFYDILQKSVNELAICLENENIVKILKSDNYKVIFPIYDSIIQSLFRSGERRKELLEQGSQFFHLLFVKFPELPEICTEKIFSYLSDEDIRVLINASNPTFVSSSNFDIKFISNIAKEYEPLSFEKILSIFNSLIRLPE